MSRSIIFSLIFILALTFMISCSGGDRNIITPDPIGSKNVAVETTGGTLCMGLWQVVIDAETGTGDITQLRSADQIINVLGFMEPPALSLMGIENLVVADPVVEVRVVLEHPIPGDAVFTGFDVRGVCFGPAVTNADGLTVVCSPEYFAGVPFGYQDGLLGAPDSYGDYSGLAGYKYFCDGLSATDDLADFFSDTDNVDDRGTFGSGVTNRRDYVLDWTDSTQPFLVFNYAIYANYNWPTGDPPINNDSFSISTANSAEAFACEATELANSLFYSSPGPGGGTISLQLEIWDWLGDINDVTIESLEPGIMAQVAYDVDLGPMPSGASYGYEFYAVPATPTEIGDLDILITVTDAKTFGECWFMTLLPASNSLYGDNIYNCFVHTTTVTDNPPPEITSGVDGNAEPFEETEEEYTVTANDPVDPLTYSWTVTDSDDEIVPGFDGVPGNGDGTIDIDWGDWPYAWALAGAEFDIDCEVSDGGVPVPAETLEVTVCVDGDLWVSNHPDFASEPDNGTKTQPYSNPYQAYSVISSNPGATIVVDYGTGSYDMTSYWYMYGSAYSNITLRGYSWYSDPGGRPTLVKRHSSSYGFYVGASANTTFQGITFSFNPSYSGNNMFYFTGRATNPTIRDCVFTGTNRSSTIQAVDEWSCPGVTFTHNLVDGLGPYNGYTSGMMYVVRHTNSISGTRTVTYNEFTDLFPSGTSYRYTQMQVIGLRTPGGTCNTTNNLIHHINPDYYSGYAAQTAYAYYNSTGNTGTYNFSNNTVDQLDFSNSSAIGYGLYAYYNYYYRAAPVAKNNIVSTYTGNPSQWMTGYYHYYNNYNGVTYCDAWDIDDYAWQGFSLMTGNIEEDPEYVNNTTAPYDYNLESGSPCEGSGASGVDMGCYGNMAAGETIIGIVTPE